PVNYSLPMEGRRELLARTFDLARNSSSSPPKEIGGNWAGSARRLPAAPPTDPDVQFSRIRLSDKVSHGRTGACGSVGSTWIVAATAWASRSNTSAAACAYLRGSRKAQRHRVRPQPLSPSRAAHRDEWRGGGDRKGSYLPLLP